MFSSILVITLCIFFNNDSTFAQEYEALVVINNLPSSPEVILPYEAKEENGKIIYPEKTEGGKKIEYLHLCPPITEEVDQELDALSATRPEIIFTLEKNLSTDQPTKCSDEVEPILTLHDDPQAYTSKCPKSDNHNLFNFGFSYIRLITDPEVDSLNETSAITIMTLYDICFNTNQNEKNERKKWTSHRVQSGYMLQGNGFPSQRIQPPYKYSTESYGLDPEAFSEVTEEYENQKQYTTYRMIPQMMVPEEDFAIKTWKKTTTHIVNTEPLWINLKPLMKTINDGIRKAAIAVNVKTYIPEEYRNINLEIYTTARRIEYHAKLKELVAKSNIYSEEQMGLNIWCKFIHYESEKKGLMIYLHNLPELPPIKTTSTSSDSKSEILYENTECEKPIHCDFRKWSDKLEGQSDDLLNYAYCCPVDNKKVDEWFDIKLDTELGLLDINDFINGGSI